MDHCIRDKKFVERFWKKVLIIGEDDCWEWQGALSSQGYGSFGIGTGKTRSAHRVLYEISVGEIPEGMCVLHKCDNRKCVNPAHLFLGTNNDNVKDMVSKGRQAKGEKNGRALLNYEKVNAIRELYREKRYTYKEIAERFRVSIHAIRKIVKNDYWKLPLVE